MDFKVGPYRYRVTTARGYLELDGELCLGLCDHERHELEISDCCSPAQRVQVICHEYMEAWLYHFGQPGMDKEAYCDLFGLAMTQFLMDSSPLRGAFQDMDPSSIADDAGSAKGGADTEGTDSETRERSVQLTPGECVKAMGRSTPGPRRPQPRPSNTRGVGRVTGVRVTEHFMPQGNGEAGSTPGWRVRVMEPQADDS